MVEFLFPRNSANSIVNSDKMRLKARKFASYVTLLLCYIFVSYLFLISDFHVRNQVNIFIHVIIIKAFIILMAI